jgi:hypothetical protein
MGTLARLAAIVIGSALCLVGSVALWINPAWAWAPVAGFALVTIGLSPTLDPNA